MLYCMALQLAMFATVSMNIWNNCSLQLCYHNVFSYVDTTGKHPGNWFILNYLLFILEKKTIKIIKKGVGVKEDTIYQN